MHKTTSLGSIIHSFEAIPTELAHQIIDDLRVWDVLKLLCYQNDRVDDSIMSHPICSIIIPSDLQSISKIRFATEFYRVFFSKLGKRHVPNDSILSLNIHCVDRQKIDTILGYMNVRIHRRIKKHCLPFHLSHFGRSKNISFAVWRPLEFAYSFEELKECWDDIQAAKTTLFKQMASELHWAADILEANPDILKRTLDPGQERRPNTAHIVSRMRRAAAKIVRSPREEFVCSEHFSSMLLPIIPFDSALNEMICLMQSRGIVMGNQVVTDSLPPSITKLIQVVICGMPCFYMSPIELRTPSYMKMKPNANEKGEIPRTGNTLWSEQLKIPVSIDGPFFTPFKTGNVYAFRRSPSVGWDPHSEMEKEWLESFVGLYRYLNGKLDISG
ncbi:hypothetical protein N7463_010654 [Penicillium fimorum]|uniref:Uncharacterized protein n=1 Tax=Penicillium fimorum TaxID=1882269 RepID=A0A9W9XKC3_9EURO|nr:hypothetical protein N7463_010654 [Penicillium fimorum]